MKADARAFHMCSQITKPITPNPSSARLPSAIKQSHWLRIPVDGGGIPTECGKHPTDVFPLTYLYLWWQTIEIFPLWSSENCCFRSPHIALTPCSRVDVILSSMKRAEKSRNWFQCRVSLFLGMGSKLMFSFVWVQQTKTSIDGKEPWHVK